MRILAGNSAQFTQGSRLPLLRPTGDRSSLPWTSGSLFLLPCGYQSASPTPQGTVGSLQPPLPVPVHWHISARACVAHPPERVMSEHSPLFQLFRRRRSNRMSEWLEMMLSLSAVLKNFHFDEIQLVNFKKESYLLLLINSQGITAFFSIVRNVFCLAFSIFSKFFTFNITFNIRLKIS